MGERPEARERYDEQFRAGRESQRPERDMRHEVARHRDGEGERRADAASHPGAADRVRTLTPDEAALLKLDRTDRQSPPSALDGGERRGDNRAVDGVPRHDSPRRLSPDEAARQKIKEADAAFEPVPDQLRKESAISSIKALEDFRPEKWREMSPERRRVALNRAGRALRDAYDCPEPPLITRELPEDERMVTLGEYEDGDYVMRVNEKLLQGDDPREALKTYIHEFRHSYQAEMATRHEKPQFRHWVHEPAAAAEWSKARRSDSYVRPEEDFERYSRQGVEQDAEGFAEELIRGVYE
ncbi:MAG: hypothetical protein JOZ96_29085 [Acidobacteria bacterium]|nr:hypothetical protein [Acidobacteriota bacterium]